MNLIKESSSNYRYLSQPGGASVTSDPPSTYFFPIEMSAEVFKIHVSLPLSDVPTEEACAAACMVQDGPNKFCNLFHFNSTNGVCILGDWYVTFGNLPTIGTGNLNVQVRICGFDNANYSRTVISHSYPLIPINSIQGNTGTWYGIMSLGKR